MPETQIKKIVESELQENNATNTVNSSHGKSQNQQKRQKKKRPFKKKVKIILRLICFVTYCFVENSYPFSAI